MEYIFITLIELAKHTYKTCINCLDVKNHAEDGLWQMLLYNHNESRKKILHTTFYNVQDWQVQHLQFILLGSCFNWQHMENISFCVRFHISLIFIFQLLKCTKTRSIMKINKFSENFAHLVYHNRILIITMAVPREEAHTLQKYPVSFAKRRFQIWTI